MFSLPSFQQNPRECKVRMWRFFLKKQPPFNSSTFFFSVSLWKCFVYFHTLSVHGQRIPEPSLHSSAPALRWESMARLSQPTVKGACRAYLGHWQQLFGVFGHLSCLCGLWRVLWALLLHSEIGTVFWNRWLMPAFPPECVSDIIISCCRIKFNFKLY